VKSGALFFGGEYAATTVADKIDPSGTASAVIHNSLTYALPFIPKSKPKANSKAEAANARLQEVIQTGGPTGGNKNISAAEVDVPGYTGETPMRARSGNQPDKSLQKVPHSPEPSPESANAIGTNPVQNYKAHNGSKGHTGKRDRDSEIFNFKDIQSHLPQGAKGSVYLKSKLEMCPSCTGAAFQFTGNNPGIKLIVFAPIGPVPEISILGTPIRNLFPSISVLLGIGSGRKD
jgi:hypothetical protein